MKISAIKESIVNNAPSIFTGLAIGGLVETTILTARATMRIQDEVFDLRETITSKPEPEVIDYIRTCWRECIPPAITFSATLFCMIAANNAHLRKEASLTALYSLYEGRYRDYKAKNRELYGKENDERVEKEVLKKEVKNNPPKIFPERAEEYLIYDEITRQYFYATYKEKEHAQEQLNRILGKESAVSWNYLLSFFKNADHKMNIGNVFGWFLDDTFMEYYYWNESFFARPYAELEFEELGKVTDQQEDIYVLRCSLEPIAENYMDDCEVMDSQDKQSL